MRRDGYEVRWTVLGACAVGAPHHRHRYYAVAVRWLGDGEPPVAQRVGGGKAICGAPRSGGRFLLPSRAIGDGRGEGDVEYWQRRLAQRGRTSGMPLGAAVNLLPTPDASMSTRGGMLSPGAALLRVADNRRSSNLDDVVASLLPSPTASDVFGAGRAAGVQGGNNLRTAISLLPTPKASDGSNGGPNQRDGAGNYYLPAVANLLPTPRATDIGTEGRRSSEGWRPQPGQAVHELLPTPTASNAHGDGENNRGELLLPGIVVRPEVWGKYAEAVALWEAITSTSAPAPTEPGAKGAPRLSPKLPEWMMGLRPGLLTDELSRPEALKGAGNGVVPLACAAAWLLITQS